MYRLSGVMHPSEISLPKKFILVSTKVHLQGDGTTWEIHSGMRLRVKVVPP